MSRRRARRVAHLPPPDKLHRFTVSLERASDLIAIPRATIRGWATRGVIPARRIGDRWWFAHDDLIARRQEIEDRLDRGLHATPRRPFMLQGDDDAAEYARIVHREPCVYCGGTAEAIDHIEPRALGGAVEWWNYAPACQRCNSKKGTRSVLWTLLSLRNEEAA